MQKLKVFIKDKIYIPIEQVDVDSIKLRYTRCMYDEPTCAKCETKPYRSKNKVFVDCKVCPAYKGTYKLYRLRGRYIGIPVGDKRLFEKITGWEFSDCKFIDKRTRGDLPKELHYKLTTEPRDYQIPLIDAMCKADYGLMDSPPRSGKTFMMTAIAARKKRVVLMLADQYEFLTQFLDHIYGNEKESIPRCTNIDELEKKVGHKLAGIPRKPEDFDNFIVLAMTYQTFLSEKGQRLLRRISKRVGMVFIDEAHSSAADCFSQIVGQMFPKAIMGFTGTVERKDGKHYIIKSTIGPVVAKTSVEMLPVKVSFIDTKIKYRSKPQHWSFAIRNIANNEKRNDLIVATALKDLRNGRSIVIPVYHVKHVQYLVDRINKEWGKKIAAPFTGGSSPKHKLVRKQILSDAKEGILRVIVGIRRLLQRGLNVPAWDTIYECMPISNKPNLRQETARIRTPGANKKPAMVRQFVDLDFPLVVGCAKNSLAHMKSFGFRICKDEASQAMASYLAQQSRGRGAGDADELDEQFKSTMNIDEDKPRLSSAFK